MLGHKKTEFQSVEIHNSRSIKQLKTYFVMILLREEYLPNYLQLKLVNVAQMICKDT